MKSPPKPPHPEEAAEHLLRRMQSKPTLAMVLGSGFQSVADAVQLEAAYDYSKVPGFPTPRVPGHLGKVLCGTLAEVPVILLCGRSHYYEGHSMETVTFPIRVLRAMGIESLLLTNAAGGINSKFKVGDFMRITDHVNAMGANPLRGAITPVSSPFVDLSQVYDEALNQLLQAAARKSGIKLRKGVYLAVSGPSYETPAEIRAFAQMGADAVGMSTVPEAIVARHVGLRVAGISCITNAAAGRTSHPLSHEEVIAVGNQCSAVAVELLTHFASLFAGGVNQKLGI